MEEFEGVRVNKEICPNCLEPNAKDLANCEFCGMPLRPEDDEITESERPFYIAPADEKPKAPEAEKKDKGRGTNQMLRYMGFVAIYMGVERIYQTMGAEVDEKNTGIIVGALYILGGIALAWPILKGWFYKLTGRELPEESSESSDTVDTAENAAESTEESECADEGTPVTDAVDEAEEA